MILKKDNLIFSCKMGVTFDKDHEDPYTIWLYDCDPNPENEYGFINPTINIAAKWLGDKIPSMVLTAMEKRGRK